MRGPEEGPGGFVKPAFETRDDLDDLGKSPKPV